MNATAAKLQKFAERGIAAQKAADAAIADARKEEFAMIATAAIVPSPLNPRKQIAEEQLEELAESIRREGILQPLLLRAKQPLLNADSSVYEIVTGERRWRAARLAALETIPAMVREMDDAAVLDAQIIENGQREDVTPLEEAAAYRLRLKIAGESGVKMTVKTLPRASANPGALSMTVSSC